jgi:hypothetical protein
MYIAVLPRPAARSPCSPKQSPRVPSCHLSIPTRDPLRSTSLRTYLPPASLAVVSSRSLATHPLMQHLIPHRLFNFDLLLPSFLHRRLGSSASFDAISNPSPHVHRPRFRICEASRIYHASQSSSPVLLGQISYASARVKCKLLAQACITRAGHQYEPADHASLILRFNLVCSDQYMRRVCYDNDTSRTLWRQESEAMQWMGGQWGEGNNVKRKNNRRQCYDDMKQGFVRR